MQHSRCSSPSVGIISQLQFVCVFLGVLMLMNNCNVVLFMEAEPSWWTDLGKVVRLMILVGEGSWNRGSD